MNHDFCCVDRDACEFGALLEQELQERGSDPGTRDQRTRRQTG